MLDIECRQDVAVIHMRHARNVLDVSILRKIAAAFEFIGGSRPVVLTGHGCTFAVDPDRRTALDDDSTAWERLRVAQRAALLAVLRHPAPVVAAINGDALDAGLALAAAADVRMMARGLIGTIRPVGTGSSLEPIPIEIVTRLHGLSGAARLVAGEALTVDHAVWSGLVERPEIATHLVDEAVARALTLAPSRSDDPRERGFLSSSA